MMATMALSYTGTRRVYQPSIHTVVPSLPPRPPSPTLFRTPVKSCLQSSSPSPSPTPTMEAGTKLREFPHVSAPTRDLMLELISCVDAHLGSSLLPCSLPPDVQFYQNPNGSAEAALLIRSAVPSSPVDAIMESWIHSKLPSGGALNITSLFTYLKPSTDAPNFLIEFIQTAPTSLIFLLDIVPRKDLLLHPEYLKAFYEDTELDKHRQHLQKLPEVTPYTSPFLYTRALFSPIAILVRIEAGEVTRIDEIFRDHLSPIANEMIKVWISFCAYADKQQRLGEAEMAYLKKRDTIIRTKGVEIDLSTNLPRLFGQEIGDRVLNVIRGAFNV